MRILKSKRLPFLWSKLLANVLVNLIRVPQMLMLRLQSIKSSTLAQLESSQILQWKICVKYTNKYKLYGTMTQLTQCFNNDQLFVKNWIKVSCFSFVCRLTFLLLGLCLSHHSPLSNSTVETIRSCSPVKVIVLKQS